MNDVTYISEEGLQTLKEELIHRKTTVRKEIAARISAAKELGDLSENFEYHQAKEDQGMNESRVVELEDMIRGAVIVKDKTGGTISLGSRFVVLQNGQERTFQMVGATEANPMAGKISNDSPIGQAFLGRGEGDEVNVNVPSGAVTYKILKVE